jgi:hypothetical protein
MKTPSRAVVLILPQRISFFLLKNFLGLGLHFANLWNLVFTPSLRFFILGFAFPASENRRPAWSCVRSDLKFHFIFLGASALPFCLTAAESPAQWGVISGFLWFLFLANHLVQICRFRIRFLSWRCCGKFCFDYRGAVILFSIRQECSP